MSAALLKWRDIDADLRADFVEESSSVLAECLAILEEIEENPEKFARLTEFANRIDRVMGGAKSFATMAPEDANLALIAEAASFCKTMGYRGALLGSQHGLLSITVAFLIDSTTLALSVLEDLEAETASGIDDLRKTLIQRVQWLVEMSAQFPVSNDSGSAEIGLLLKKLGMK